MEQDTGQRVRLVGPKEIAALHGSPKETAWRWKGRGRLPAPDLVVSDHDVWHLGTVERWSRQTGRYQPAIERWSAHIRWSLDGEQGLTFEQLYDLLQLGTADPLVDKYGLPPAVEREHEPVSV